MIRIGNELIFPPTSLSDARGLLCYGGDLSIPRLLLAYRSGIFPWYSEGEPILWYSPNPRFVLFPDEIRISKSMRQVIRRGRFEFRMNTQFTSVIRHCKEVDRRGQPGTWINEDMVSAYCELHTQGHAISAECYEQGELVGGLYGILGKRVFFGESMFSLVPNASKFAFIHLVEHYAQKDIELIDCQMHTAHLESLGGRNIDRKQFESYLM
jgi:leucyl/phenylalanyl-tRNA--protein transferase